MLKIRLKRLGRKRVPFYRVVVAHATSRRDGAPVEELGFYNPLSKELRLDKTAAQDWIKKGAQPTDTAKWLIEQAGDNPKEVIRLDRHREEKLSKKALAKKQAEEKAAAEVAAKAAETAAVASVATGDASPDEGATL